MQSVFEHDDYRKYFVERLAEIYGSQHGSLSAAAKVMGCQPGYLTQILQGRANLSAEQVDRINQYFSHSIQESRYFFHLVQLERAGTESLRKFISSELQIQKAQREKTYVVRQERRTGNDLGQKEMRRATD